MARTTKEVLESHYKAFRKGVDAIVMDYAEDAILMAPNGVHKGRAAIKQFFIGELAGFPEGFWQSLKTLRLDIESDFALFLWQAKPWYPVAADSFTIRDGQIVFQSTSVNIEKDPKPQ
jgi:ketosteroid isomerase-like protein